MPKAQIETRRTDWIICRCGPWHSGLPHGGYVAYRISTQFDGLRWFQRHEWKCADGSVESEEWISGNGSHVTGGKPVSLTA